MNIRLMTSEGGDAGTHTAFTSLDHVSVTPSLLRQIAVTMETNRRVSRAHTKDRAERRGGGIKPWRQKGTGRARAGSRRSPIWRKGGVTFGPRAERNYSARAPKSMKKAALGHALVGKIQDNEFFALDALPTMHGKTSELVLMLSRLPVKGSTLFLVPGSSTVRAPFRRAGRNVPSLTVENPETVTVADLLRHTTVLTTRDGVDALEARVRKESQEA